MGRFGSEAEVDRGREEEGIGIGRGGRFRFQVVGATASCVPSSDEE